MNTRTTLYALLAAGLLAVGAFAAPVLAEGEDDDSSSDSSSSKSPREQREAAKERAEAQREAAKERAEAQREAAKERCLANETLNESQQERCMKGNRTYAEHAFKARRESHALLGAIAAIERRIGRLEVKEMELQEELDSGNFTGNHTAENVTLAIEKIQDHQERLAEKLAHLKERLEALHAKWQAVREHVEEKRHRGALDDDEDDESDDDMSSSSSSSATLSESSTSSAAA